MSEFKGTKGKWIAEKNSCYFDVTQEEKRTYSDGERILCVTVSLQEMCTDKVESISHSEESEANAKLIACAPEMLEMIKILLSDIKTKITESPAKENRINQVEQLIKKATE